MVVLYYYQSNLIYKTRNAMSKLLTSFLALLLLQISPFVFAQQKQVTGTVVSQANVPVSGASVVVKNSTRGTQTNPEGQFTISAAVGDKLTISAVGYASKEVAIGSASSINITLQTTEGELAEVVVTAFYHYPRRDFPRKRQSTFVCH